jgi:hypothetical protein
MSDSPPPPMEAIIAKYVFPMSVELESGSLATLKSAKPNNAFCAVMSVNKMAQGNVGKMYFAPLEAGGYRRPGEQADRFVNTAFEGSPKIGGHQIGALDSASTPHVQLVDFIIDDARLECENTDFVGFTLRFSPEYTFKDQSQSQNEKRSGNNVRSKRPIPFAMFQQLTNESQGTNTAISDKTAGGQMSIQWIQKIKAILVDKLGGTWADYINTNEFGR